MNGLQEEYGRDYAILKADVDTQKGKELARRAGFIGQPSFVFYDASGQEVRRLMGPQSTETIRLAMEGAMSR